MYTTMMQSVFNHVASEYAFSACASRHWRSVARRDSPLLSVRIAICILIYDQDVTDGCENESSDTREEFERERDLFSRQK